MAEYNVYGKKSYAFALGRISGTAHRPLTAEQTARLREADFQTAQKLRKKMRFVRSCGKLRLMNSC